MSGKGKTGKSVRVAALLLTIVMASLMMLFQRTIFSYASPETEYSLSVFPTRIQEGLDTNITVSLLDADINATYTLIVNVTSPSNVSYSTNINVETNGTGVGSNSTQFWTNFAGANTDLVGTYNITLLNTIGNETYATTNFEVGLTDKTRYLRSETVSIRGSGYEVDETVSVDVKLDNASVFTTAINASADHVVDSSWQIPADAVLGVYTVTLSNASTPGTTKSPADFQRFTIEGICDIHTRNLADEPLADLTIEVYNATSSEYLDLNQKTNETGGARFLLEAGNYTFKVFWRNVEVGAVNKSITENVQLPLQVSLSHLKLLVTDEVAVPIPLVDFNLQYNYTNRANTTISEKRSFTTDITGIILLQNTFTKVNYLIETRRYDLLLNTTFIESLPAQAWNNITIIAPTYTATVEMLDSKNNPVADLRVSAYEWSSGTTQPLETATSVDGKVAFSLTFGRYRLRAFDDSLVLNETTLDLTEDNLDFTFYLTTLNVDVTVWVQDYFGQPLANANVTIEHKIGDEYLFAYSQFTGSDGSTTFSSKVGGESRITIYVGGELIAAKTQFLSGGPISIHFQIDENVAILGYPIPTALFTILVFLIVLAVMIVILARGKLIKALRKKRKK